MELDMRAFSHAHVWSSGPRRKPGLAGNFADARSMALAGGGVHPSPSSAFDLDRRKDYD
jgi:hypothetical protein